MKLKIKYKLLNSLFTLEKHGCWIDLKTIEDMSFNGPYANILSKDRTKRDVVFNNQMISLGIAMELPKEFEAVVVPRSSTFKKYGLLLSNSVGIIDDDYCGDNDIWGFNAIAFKDVVIPAGTRIAQFSIRPSMGASVKTKLKWLFTSHITFNEVISLNNQNRGGFGSSGN